VDAFLLADVSIHPGTDQRGTIGSSFLACKWQAVSDTSFHSWLRASKKKQKTKKKKKPNIWLWGSWQVCEKVLCLSVKVKRWALILSLK
jgi:hypothetical protein